MSASNESFQAPPAPPTPESKPRGTRPVKLRPFGIAFFALGLLVLGAGIPKILVGGISTGIILAIFGILLFVFSFIPLPAVSESDEPPLSFFDRITGIFYEPSRVFRNLRAHPRWVGPFVVAIVLTTIYSFAFVQRVTPERIVDYMTSKIAELPPPFTPPPSAMEKMKADQLAEYKNPVQRIEGLVKASVGLFVVAALVAALCMLGVLVFGGRMNFWQALSVVFHVWVPVMAIQKLLGLVILYLKAPEDLHPVLHQETTLQDNLGILMSPAEHPVLFVLLSFIGLTWFYLVWLRAKGLRFAGTKVGSGAAWGVSITIYILFMLFVTVWTSLFPGFIS
ncbi:MAG TPA: YIP1 family protein [Pyrinomonadaceae bacterium]|nr:YIP1 family protein [Pyrinomonadaceae bacterium]